MKEFTEVLQFFLQFKDSPIDWAHFVAAFIISLLLISGTEYQKIKVKREKCFNLLSYLCLLGISLVVDFIFVWLLGPAATIIYPVVGILLSYCISNKYFSSLQVNLTAEEVHHQEELESLQSKFKKTPNYSILEVLLFYGYISPLQKDFVEVGNIFQSPEEMAEKLLDLPVLTAKQLGEARAIMNVNRLQGKILTKEEALLAISNIEERRCHNEEGSDESNK